MSERDDYRLALAIREAVKRLEEAPYGEFPDLAFLEDACRYHEEDSGTASSFHSARLIRLDNRLRFVEDHGPEEGMVKGAGNKEHRVYRCIAVRASIRRVPIYLVESYITDKGTKVLVPRDELRRQIEQAGVQFDEANAFEQVDLFVDGEKHRRLCWIDDIESLDGAELLGPTFPGADLIRCWRLTDILMGGSSPKKAESS